jgi:hypothetical protein
VAESLWRDYQRGGRRDKPAFLAQALPEVANKSSFTAVARPSLPKRQARHVVPEQR